MSDDEEIVYKGKSVGLYNYLTGLGYADFETFESENLTRKDQFHSFHTCNDHPVDSCAERVNNFVSKSYSLKITDHDYKKLVAILNSQLIFKEDAYLIQSLLQNKQVCSQRPNYVFHTSVVLTSLLSSVLMLRSNVKLGLVQYVIPASCTVLLSCYSAWQFYKEFDENRKDNLLINHVNDLKQLCFSILKLTRFIKETEILSSSQVPVNGIGSVLNVPGKHIFSPGTDISISTQWKTLPHLRKCLSDAVKEVLNILKISVDSLRQCVVDKELVDYDLTVDYKSYERSEKGCCPVTLLDLKELTSKYLSVQSEYLKELAFIFSSIFLKDIVSDTYSKKSLRDKAFKMLRNTQKKFTDISFKLVMQYNIHNVAATFQNVSCKSSSSNSAREINELQIGVHNIFLLLYSALLRVRNLEDTLENCLETGEDLKMKDKLNLVVTEQLTVLKDDLISTVKCYDVLCQQTLSNKNIVTKNEKAEDGCTPNMTETSIKETGIVVGTSDFTVNSPDEVFLSLSGANHETTSISECTDEWYLERKQQIPKSLLSELSHILKSRKTDFVEREKHALQRKGIEDVGNSSPSSDEDSGESDDSVSQKHDGCSTKYKRHVAARDYSNSSDSDDEMDPFESGAFLTKLKMSKKYQSEPYSDSDSSVLSDCIKETTCEREVTSEGSLSTLSLANLAALKSQMWGKNKEENYSDGSDS